MIVKIISEKETKKIIEEEIRIKTEHIERKIDELRIRINDLERIGGNLWKRDIQTREDILKES